MIRRYIDVFIKKQYHSVRGWVPFYLEVWGYKLCVYAMNMDWDSLRIKIEKDHEIVYVLKKGKY